MSVVWWKQYYKFGFDIKYEDHDQKYMNKVFVILRLREKDGL